ncbi:hypothetical protein Peur_013779 [Populus x canadensis]
MQCNLGCTHPLLLTFEKRIAGQPSCKMHLTSDSIQTSQLKPNRVLIIRRFRDQEAKKERLNTPGQNPSYQKVAECCVMVLTNSAVWFHSSLGTKRYMFHWICNCQNPPSSATQEGNDKKKIGHQVHCLSRHQPTV